MDKTKTVVWQALSWPSTVVHAHMINNGIYDHGVAVGKTDCGIPFAMEYEVILTEDWNIKELGIKSLLDERVIKLMHRGDQWYDGEGRHLAEFEGIELVDISISPFTNTLPIKRLQFERGQPQKVDVIYFNENKFSLSRMQQIYSKVDDRTYRYQDIELPGFVSDIVMDNDGLVVDFQKMFKRV